MIGVEHMRDSTMFTLSNKFYDLNKVVDSLRQEHRAVILKMVNKESISLFENIILKLSNSNLISIRVLEIRPKIYRLVKEYLKRNIGY